jgi:hypothetical protein
MKSYAVRNGVKPEITTAEESTIGLGVDDEGAIFYNTDTDLIRTWDGTAFNTASGEAYQKVHVINQGSLGLDSQPPTYNPGAPTLLWGSGVSSDYGSWAIPASATAGSKIYKDTNSAAWSWGELSCFIHASPTGLPAGSYQLSVYATLLGAVAQAGDSVNVVWAVDKVNSGGNRVSHATSPVTAINMGGGSSPTPVTLDVSGNGNWQFQETFNSVQLDHWVQIAVGLNFYNTSTGSFADESSWSWSWRLDYIGPTS